MGKRRLFLAVIASIFMSLNYVAVSAQNDDLFRHVCQGGTESSAVCRDKEGPADTGSNALFGPNGIITRASQILTIAVGVASVVMIIVGGIKYVLSAGDSAKVSSAKNTVIYALVGILVALLAQAIIAFVLNKI